MADGLTLRNIARKDSLSLWRWRNHPEVRLMSFNSRPVSLAEHKKWFATKIKDAHSRVYIAKFRENKAGVIRFEVEDETVRVSVNLNPKFFGRGIGSRVIKLGTTRFVKKTGIKKPIIAEIKRDNIASQKAFLRARYRFKKEDKDKLIYEFSG